MDKLFITGVKPAVARPLQSEGGPCPAGKGPREDRCLWQTRFTHRGRPATVRARALRRRSPGTCHLPLLHVVRADAQGFRSGFSRMPQMLEPSEIHSQCYRAAVGHGYPCVPWSAQLATIVTNRSTEASSASSLFQSPAENSATGLPRIGHHVGVSVASSRGRSSTRPVLILWSEFLDRRESFASSGQFFLFFYTLRPIS
jgi:hypothetical protein